MIAKEKRTQRKINELGCRNPKCQICGETDPAMLTRQKSLFLEEHHIAGNHEGDTIIVCLNCHAKLTDNQLDWPEGLFAENKTPEMVSVGFLFGLAAILGLLAVYCFKHANNLYDFISRVQVVNPS